MIAHRRYLQFRNGRSESQNGWLTTLASAALLILILVMTAGPTALRLADEELASEQDSMSESPAATYRKD